MEGAKKIKKKFELMEIKVLSFFCVCSLFEAFRKVTTRNRESFWGVLLTFEVILWLHNIAKKLPKKIQIQICELLGLPHKKIKVSMMLKAVAKA
jgi:hypothetical protein